MKKFFGKLVGHLKLLDVPIYSGNLLEKNLKAITVLGIIMVVFGAVMTVLNVVQEKGILIATSALFAACGLFNIISAAALKKRLPAAIATLIASALIITYYAVFGTNGGFSILWMMLMPLAVCYFFSVKYGILLSVFFEVLLVVMFYTPLKGYFSTYYDAMFMSRFPLLYLCEVLITGIAMSQYHEGALLTVRYTDKLNEEVQRQTQIANERADRLGRLSDEMVQALARAIDAKDKYTTGHSFRVSEYSVALAEKMGWKQEDVNSLKREALLHDIGKIGVPDAVLNKPGKLTPEEYETIKAHTTIGNNILEGLEDMTDVATVILYHHERYDGKGYPRGLAGKDIPDRARIVAIADAYDAMNSNRIYRDALTPEAIRTELEKGRGKQFDPDYLTAFIDLLEQGKLA